MNNRIITTAALVTLCAMWLLSTAPVLAQQTTATQISVPIDGEYGYGLPPAVYKHNYAFQVDLLIHVLHWFMALLFVGWGTFFVYCLVRFRQRPGHRANRAPVKAKVSKWTEIGVAVFEGCLLIGLSIPVWAEVKNELPTDADNPMHVRVVAEQFAWNFHYPGPDGVFGKTAPEHIEMATNPLGKDPDDPNGEDDVVSGELHFPKDRPVIAYITSKDVIHSFAVPVLRVKQDAIPGMRIPAWFEAAIPGNYEVACAQLCGSNHYSMKALMVVHNTEREFEAWRESQKPEEFDEDEFED